ncbi:hypothetical protein BCR32DRAFT_291525 [Anaeromyces robustus]|uniref:RING-type domain-containing protein n=1 Tax=Anaeromyces robustus TaxID=1754192 RepID=A0A1Y1XEM6_9FUNG|nr:hypothetical protein BCR32DRAFT_291525 [Anaeromyces robustus]|eukprot:ORX84199.1 hypothetical protein BCR32DRAFT_291525 [Anaeromyces robustus]
MELNTNSKNDKNNVSSKIVVTQPTKKNIIINDIDNSHSIIEINSVMIPEVIKQETTTITTTTTIKQKRKKRKRKGSIEQDSNTNNNDLNELCDISFTSVYSTTSSISSISNDFYSTSLISNNSSIEEIPLTYHPFNKNHLFLNDIKASSTDNISVIIESPSSRKGKEKEIDITDINDTAVAKNMEKLKQKQKHLSFSEDTSSKHSFSSVSFISKKKISNNKPQISDSNRMSISSSNINIPLFNDILNSTSSSSSVKLTTTIPLENKLNLKEKDEELKLKRKSNISEVNFKYLERNVLPYNRHSLTEGNFSFNNITDFNSLNILKENQMALKKKNDSNSFYSFTQNSSPLVKFTTSSNSNKTYSKSVVQKETLKNDLKNQNPYFLNKDMNEIYSIMSLNSKINQQNLRTLSYNRNNKNINNNNNNNNSNGNGNDIKSILINNISFDDIQDIDINFEDYDSNEDSENENSSNFGFIQRTGYSKPEGLKPWIEKDDFNLEKEKCSICFEDFKLESSIPFMLVCQHYFHFECIFKWCCQEDNSKCPLCREPIDKNYIFDDIIFEFDSMEAKDLGYSTILPEVEHEISTTSTTTLAHSKTETTRSTTSNKFNYFPTSTTTTTTTTTTTNNNKNNKNNNTNINNDLNFTTPLSIVASSSSLFSSSPISSIHSPVYSSISKTSYPRHDDKFSISSTSLKEVFNKPSLIKSQNKISTISHPLINQPSHSLPRNFLNHKTNSNRHSITINTNNNVNNTNTITNNINNTNSNKNYSHYLLNNNNDDNNNYNNNDNNNNDKDNDNNNNNDNDNDNDNDNNNRNLMNSNTNNNNDNNNRNLMNTNTNNNNNNIMDDLNETILESTDITLNDTSISNLTQNTSFVTVNDSTFYNNNNNNNNVILTIDNTNNIKSTTTNNDDYIYNKSKS